MELYFGSQSKIGLIFTTPVFSVAKKYISFGAESLIFFTLLTISKIYFSIVQQLKRHISKLLEFNFNKSELATY